MKNLVYVICFFFTTVSQFAQEDEGNNAKCELNIQIFNNPSLYTVDFVTAPIYDMINGYLSSIYFAQINSCNFNIVNPEITFYTDFERTISLQGSNNYCVDNGFDYSLNQPPTTNGCSGYPNTSRANFQSALYIISVKINNVEKTKFYYDNRHSQFPSNPCSLPGFTGNDICVRYDVAANKLYYKYYPTSLPSMNGFTEFKKAEVINWWEVASIPTYDLSGFQTRYFAILNSPTSINNSPYLTWQAPNVANLVVDHYELQRCLPPNDFQTIYSTNNSLSYHDLDIYWNPNFPNSNSLVQYRVITFFQNHEPLELSNIRKLYIDISIQKKNFGNEEQISFYLDQNFPNPFNPTTKIAYNILISGFVSLKVFNFLGEEVAIILNQFQEAGYYEVEFNGRSLPSGMYVYRLDSQGHVQNKKMIITK